MDSYLVKCQPLINAFARERRSQRQREEQSPRKRSNEYIRRRWFQIIFCTRTRSKRKFPVILYLARRDLLTKRYSRLSRYLIESNIQCYINVLLICYVIFIIGRSCLIKANDKIEVGISIGLTFRTTICELSIHHGRQDCTEIIHCS